MARRLLSLGVGVLVLVGSTVFAAHAQQQKRVEVVEVKGIIDASVERAVVSTIELARREEAELVVLQIDSEGVIDEARLRRLRRAIRASDVPVAAWVGPVGSEARNGAALLVGSAPIRATSPLSRFGPVRTLDLRDRGCPGRCASGRRPELRAGSVSELLAVVDGLEVSLDGGRVELATDPDEVTIRFRKLDLWGRLLHAAAQPSITYLLLLLALVGIVFELFHPSTGPAGIAGLAALAMSIYGIVTLGGSWLGFALIVLGVAGFAVDLRFQSLGPLTAAGFAALVAGSLLLFGGPWLRVSPWILAFGITSMVLFLLGAMTRVLRDLRAIARGELETRDPHPEGGH